MNKLNISDIPTELKVINTHNVNLQIIEEGEMFKAVIKSSNGITLCHEVEIDFSYSWRDNLASFIKKLRA